MAPKRGAETTALILTEALRLGGGEVGYEALTMERLAERTGVAKTTIYRRWPNISTVVMDAFLAEAIWPRQLPTCQARAKASPCR